MLIQTNLDKSLRRVMMLADLDPVWTATMLAAILDDFGCPACQSKHVLCFESDGDIDSEATPDPRAKYQYVCPKRRAIVRVVPQAWNLVDVDRPPNAIRLIPMPHRFF